MEAVMNAIAGPLNKFGNFASHTLLNLGPLAWMLPVVSYVVLAWRNFEQTKATGKQMLYWINVIGLVACVALLAAHSMMQGVELKDDFASFVVLIGFFTVWQGYIFYLNHDKKDTTSAAMMGATTLVCAMLVVAAFIPKDSFGGRFSTMV
jgi:FtsH-binding integral membrane protein